MKEKMKKTVGIVFTAAFAAAAYGEEAAEQPAGLEEESDEAGLFVEASVDVLSDYVWRGTIYNDNPVWQPSVTVGYDADELGALSLNVWSTFDATHKRGTATHSRRSCGAQEFDYTLSYSRDFGPVGVEVGHVWYVYPNNNGNSDQELFGTVAYNNDWVTPSASAYWNYSDSAGNDVSSAYFSFKLSRDFEVMDDLTITPMAEIGFGDHAYTESAGGTELTDQTTGVAASYKVTDWFSIGAQINYTWTPSHTLRHEGYMGEGKDQLVWGGLSATISF
jgi:hypothetical protein